MKRLLYCALGCALIFTTFLATPKPTYAQFSYIPSLYNGPLPLCRLGINGSLLSYPIKPLRLGWFVDYTAIATPAPTLSITYFPVIRLEQTSTGYNFSFKPNRPPATEAELRQAVAARPGLYWLIGNEPDRIQFQDDIEPHIYARAYHDLYQIIKDEDPTAKIVAGTIVQPTPIRLQYLDLILASYFQMYKEPMPVDAWSFHNFILNEASCSYYEDKVTAEELGQVCWGAEIPPGVNATDGLRIDVQDNDDIDLFKEQVIRFRQWMADRGYRNTPAFLSEFGILMPQGLFNPDFDSARVNAFMNKSFDFLMNTTDPNTGYPGDNNRLVQRFAWYSVDDNINHNGFIFDRTKPVANSQTDMGNNFAAFGRTLDADVDFIPTALSMLGTPVTSQGVTTVTLQAVIGNSGNVGVAQGATVRFFNGNPNSGGVQIGSEQTVSIQGCGEQSTVKLEWSVAPGDYTVFVQVDALVAEADETNNQRSTTVHFTDERLLIPNVRQDMLFR